jgi:DNA-directed RNA polymerase specialized sigma24 family protein
LHHPKDAEDAAQEVFVKLYLSLPQYERQGFKTWLTRIAVNQGIDVKRRLQRKTEDLAEEMAEQAASASPPLACEGLGAFTRLYAEKAPNPG